jgi:hypothetical protein
MGAGRRHGCGVRKRGLFEQKPEHEQSRSASEAAREEGHPEGGTEEETADLAIEEGNGPVMDAHEGGDFELDEGEQKA